MVKFAKPTSSVRGNGKSLVSKVGYVDNQHRINAMLREGMQLRQFRMNLESDEEARISEEIMKNVDRIDSPVGTYHDKIDSIALMRAQLNNLESKFKTANEQAIAARQKAREQEKEDSAARDKAEQERFAKYMESYGKERV